MTRLFSLIGPLTGDRHVVQTANHPLDPDKMLPVADVVLLASDDTGGAMIFRYTAHGEFGGDTLHASVADAKSAAEDEYAEALVEWDEVPDEIADAHAFVVRYAYERLNDRGGGYD